MKYTKGTSKPAPKPAPKPKTNMGKSTHTFKNPNAKGRGSMS